MDYLVFTGRPNAGKSSMISSITGLKLPVGKRPGTTTKIEEYPLAKGLTLVDMPGYGMKKGASKRWEDRTKDLILDFLQREAKSIALAVHVFAVPTFLEVERRLANKGYISVDVEMVGFLQETLGEFPLIAANKIDKGDQEDVKRNLIAFMSRISGGKPELVEDYVYPVSAKTGEGVGELKSAIHQRLVQRGHLRPFDYV